MTPYVYEGEVTMESLLAWITGESATPVSR